MEKVPGHFEVWAPEDVRGRAGAKGTPVRLLASRHRASAMIVSVEIGRAGPCCSVAPSGNKIIEHSLWSALICGQVISASSNDEALLDIVANGGHAGDRNLFHNLLLLRVDEIFQS